MSVGNDDASRVEIVRVETLSDRWRALRQYQLRYRRRDGATQEMAREVYVGRDGAVALLIDRVRKTILLTRQFRLAARLNGCADGMLLEAAAGLLDSDAPADAIRREIEEETGYRIGQVDYLFAAYSSPGSLTERLHYFLAEYRAEDRVGPGGGHPDEGEDIETIELSFDEALAMIGRGEIVDSKTIILIYHVRAVGLI